MFTIDSTVTHLITVTRLITNVSHPCFPPYLLPLLLPLPSFPHPSLSLFLSPPCLTLYTSWNLVVVMFNNCLLPLHIFYSTVMHCYLQHFVNLRYCREQSLRFPSCVPSLSGQLVSPECLSTAKKCN